MKHLMLFEEFSKKTIKKKKKKVKSETSDFQPPEYVVQPAKNDTGFFMFKKAFDSMKKKFETGFFSSNMD